MFLFCHERAKKFFFSFFFLVELLGLLEWQTKQSFLKGSLEMLIKRENDKIGAEIVKVSRKFEQKFFLGFG